MDFEEIAIYHNIITKSKIMCKCGHSITLPPHLDKVVCHWCGMYVFRDKKTEFKFRLNERMRKNK